MDKDWKVQSLHLWGTMITQLIGEVMHKLGP